MHASVISTHERRTKPADAVARAAQWCALGLLVGLVGCGAVAKLRPAALVEQSANLEASVADYAAIDCAGCSDCDRMKAAVGAGFTAASGIRDDSPEQAIADGLLGVKAAAASAPEGCGCAQDAEVCPFSKRVLVAYDGMATDLLEAQASGHWTFGFLDGVLIKVKKIVGLGEP